MSIKLISNIFAENNYYLIQSVNEHNDTKG